jgi:hypothetical protein
MKRQATMIRSIFTAVLLLAAAPLAAQTLNGVSVGGTLTGSIRNHDPFHDPNSSCSALDYSITAVATGPIAGSFSGNGHSEVVFVRCDIYGQGSVLTMSFQIDGPTPVTGTITYSGLNPAGAARRGLQILTPGIPPIIHIPANGANPAHDFPNPPARYEAHTATGRESGVVSFRLEARAPTDGSSVAEGTFVAFFESTEVPFAEMSAKAEIKARGRFEVKAVFTLGAASNGIDLLTEDVVVGIGDLEVTIPAGSFRATRKEGFKFEGSVDGIAIAAQVRPLGGATYEFKAEGAAAGLAVPGGPLELALKIGDDAGAAAAKADR